VRRSKRAAAIARQDGGVLSVRALRKAKAGIVVTGSEVYHGLIQDRFAPILTEKVTALAWRRPGQFRAGRCRPHSAGH
jgi:hypothetical protein